MIKSLYIKEGGVSFTLKPKIREKVWLRLDPDLIARTKEQARTDYMDEKKWREVVETALTEYFAKRVDDVSLASLLSTTEHALFDRLYGKIENEFDDMVKRMTNRVGGLIATSSYDTALTAILLEDLYKKSHADRYDDARKLAAERMKSRWKREGADEVQNIIAEKKAAEDEVRKLRAEIERLEEQEKKYHENLTRSKRVIDEMKEEKQQTTATVSDYQNVISWTKGLMEHLENSKLLTNAKTSFDQYLKENAPPVSLNRRN
jgi:hypothetical protein